MTSQASGSELALDPTAPKVAAPVGIFFLLTFLVTWACWIPVVRRLRPGTPASSALWLLGVFAPSLVALALTAWYEGTSSAKALLGRIVQWKVGGRWYLFALSYMVVIKLAVAVVHRLALGSWPRFGHEGPAVILIAILVSTPVQAGEEMGWRGYALPRLAKRMGFARASLLIGVVWAGWHLPQFFLRGADTYGQSFPIWSLEVIAMSVAITWLYTHTNGSVLLPMLMHSAINNTKDIVPSGAANATNAFSVHASSVLYLTAGLLWITAAYFLIRMPNRTK
ncbi:MAG TPA: CPBP family intramembrane glutamic endopeptidase [Candidatus Acidoferrales bacterium]|nr:CPBP family intramembrane glutamic endopeptidase [Candidatus Acidoferrales bacterium]